jgi:hypothetical protein
LRDELELRGGDEFCRQKVTAKVFDDSNFDLTSSHHQSCSAHCASRHHGLEHEKEEGEAERLPGK